MKIAIISANYGSYDSVKPILPQVNCDVEWIYVTDSEVILKEATNLGWQAIYRPLPHLHPNRAAKYPKMQPWKYTRCTKSIWIDASFRIKSETMAHELIDQADPIAQFVHPWRDCVYEELEASLHLPKYAGQPMRSQVSLYKNIHPEHWGLWATGLIARYHTPKVMRMGDAWLNQCLMWSFQDQLSQAVMLRINGLRPNPLPGTHFSNDWVVYEGSGNH